MIFESPLYHIATNAGDAGDVVVEKVKKAKGNEGFNALTGKYEDMVKAMIIDPKKVTRSALENAASVASMFLTLESAIAEIPKEPDPAQAAAAAAAMGGMGGGMGGMM